jgi:prolyl oligopeptidase
MRGIIAGLAAAVLAACSPQEEAKVTNSLDPKSDAHLYLEEVEGAEALAWVRGENERTLKVLEGDARIRAITMRR